jgi:hypothetical protein
MQLKPLMTGVTSDGGDLAADGEPFAERVSDASDPSRVTGIPTDRSIDQRISIQQFLSEQEGE